MDQLNTLRIFVAVATLGSFAEAGRRLRLSPSVITRAVAQLEDQLGLTLITRTTRSLKLTERGQIYLESSRRLLDDLEDADRRVRGQDAEPRGKLTVAAPVLFGRLHVLPLVGEVLAAYPALAIQLQLSDRNVHLVEDGVDVAIRIGDLDDSSLIAVRLGEVSRVVVASPGYLVGHPAPKSPADLARHDIVAFEAVQATDEWRFGERSVRLTPRLSVNSAEAAIAAAEQGLGVTRALSYQVRDAVRAGRLVLLLPQDVPPPSPVSVIYPARRVASANVAVFVKAARAFFGPGRLAFTGE